MKSLCFLNVYWNWKQTSKQFLNDLWLDDITAVILEKHYLGKRTNRIVSDKLFGFFLILIELLIARDFVFASEHEYLHDILELWELSLRHPSGDLSDTPNAWLK